MVPTRGPRRFSFSLFVAPWEFWWGRSCFLVDSPPGPRPGGPAGARFVPRVGATPDPGGRFRHRVQPGLGGVRPGDSFGGPGDPSGRRSQVHPPGGSPGCGSPPPGGRPGGRGSPGGLVGGFGLPVWGASPSSLADPFGESSFAGPPGGVTDRAGWLRWSRAGLVVRPAPEGPRRRARGFYRSGRGGPVGFLPGGAGPARGGSLLVADPVGPPRVGSPWLGGLGRLLRRGDF